MTLAEKLGVPTNRHPLDRVWTDPLLSEQNSLVVQRQPYSAHLHGVVGAVSKGIDHCLRAVECCVRESLIEAEQVHIVDRGVVRPVIKRGRGVK